MKVEKIAELVAGASGSRSPDGSEAHEAGAPLTLFAAVLKHGSRRPWLRAVPRESGQIDSSARIAAGLSAARINPSRFRR